MSELSCRVEYLLRLQMPVPTVPMIFPAGNAVNLEMSAALYKTDFHQKLLLQSGQSGECSKAKSS